jgi:hypothetical protein
MSDSFRANPKMSMDPFSSGGRPLVPSPMFNFGKPKTAGDWTVHIAGAILAYPLRSLHAEAQQANSIRDR